MAALRTGREVQNVIIGIYNKSEGSYRWINSSAFPLFQPGESKPFQAYNIFYDITELKRSQELLRQSEERFRKMFEEHQAIMFLIDPESGQIVDGNQSAAEFYGYSRKELQSMRIASIIYLQAGQSIDKWNNSLNHPVYIISHHRLASGEIRIVEVLSSAILLNNKTILFSIINDVTESERAKEDLETSELRYRNLIESMDEGFILGEMIYDETGKAIDFKYLIVNPAAAVLMGTSVEEITGQSNLKVFSYIKPFWVELYEEVVKSGISKRINSPEYEEGKYIEIHTWRTGPGQFGSIFNDVTKHKEMEEKIKQLYKKERLQRRNLQNEAKVKNLFIDILAHELRNPLTSILSCSGMLEDLTATGDENINRLSANINRGSVILAKRLDELLDIARFSKGTFKLNKQTINMELLLSEIIVRFKPALISKNQVIELTITGKLGEIVADGSRIEQVIDNLLSNASKFGPKNNRIYVSSRIENRKWIIEVKDEGPGISEENQAHLFEAYHRISDTFQTPGIGLGLYICKQIVKAHKGDIRVSSNLGEGSTFRVSLPLNLKSD
jgi:PAS domain S-box-containing protein